jgi:glycosyltransferase involved in cell wall biosynthesis
MKVLVLAKYDQLAASTRYRYTQFMPVFEKNDIFFTISPLFDDDYLKSKLSLGRAAIGPVVRGFFRRLGAVLTARQYDHVILHCEAFPYLPPFFEMLLKILRVPYSYDFDDAIFHQYDRHRLSIVRWAFRNKVSTIIRGASDVFAGNPYLAEYARRFNSHVHVVPTVVDTDRYVMRDLSTNNPVFTIGWIGSPSTAVYLNELAPAFRKLAQKFTMKLVLIGSGPFEMPGVPLEVQPWNEAAEIDELRKFDVGIMPLPDTDWARGKCGFKIIQYMACGIPAVASPIGVNRDIIDDTVNGYLAHNENEWLQTLEKLHDFPETRTVMGEAGFRKVAEEYSLKSIAPRLIALIKAKQSPSLR